MIIINDIKKINPDVKTSVALGNFDGLHLGHIKIMEDAISSAKAGGLASLCFTFSNHPLNFILRREECDPNAVKLICSEEDKAGLIEAMGFDILVNIPFDELIMKMSAESFFKDIVLSKLNAACVSAGFNYSYGSRAGGNAETLRAECTRSGIEINIHDAVKVDGRLVSSTLIREMVKNGDMESVLKFLGRPLSYSGTVLHGRHLGSSKGFPTANITAEASRILPPFGVYFTRIVTEEATYNGVSNIGVKPTVNTSTEDRADVSIESYLFDYEGDLYGKEINVLFDHFSRPEKQFKSKDELFEQIACDCRNAAEYRQIISDKE